MGGLFLKLINMSVTASYVILFVIFIRLFLKKVPKIYSYGLWLIVLFRLLIPISFSSVFSMIPISSNPIPVDIMYAAKPEINSGMALVDRAVNNSLPTPVVAASVNPIQIWLLLGQFIWLAGIVIILIYSILSTLKLTKQLKSSKHLKENIYLVNHIETPFVFGLLRPKIYLPFGLSEMEQSYMIRHEETHIKRCDHIIKFIAFIARSIHWFNPLVWLGFSLMSKDMELSCDEKVISEMGSGIKKDYSHSLLSLSSSKKVIGSSPLAFGGENTKGRIKNILTYKKPGFWATLVGIIAIVVAVIGLLSNPQSSGIAVEEETLIKGFIMNYYSQLSYTGQEIAEVEQEMEALGTVLSLDGKSDKVSSEKVKPNGFYYFYKESLSPELYDTMVRNRKIPNSKMMEMAFPKSEITNLKLKKEKDTIHASFKVVCYLSENLTEETVIQLDFVLKKTEGKIYIDSINGDLTYVPIGYERAEIKKDTTYDRISAYMKEVSIATFSPYYELLEFNISNYQEEIIDGSVHATFYYQIIEKNYDKDPDTVGYIKEAKDNGSSYYQQMYDEYLQPRESNFDLKIVIDENDAITLYSNISPNGIEWEETKMEDYILPKEEEVASQDQLSQTFVSFEGQMAIMTEDVTLRDPYAITVDSDNNSIYQALDNAEFTLNKNDLVVVIEEDDTQCRVMQISADIPAIRGTVAKNKLSYDTKLFMNNANQTIIRAGMSYDGMNGNEMGIEDGVGIVLERKNNWVRVLLPIQRSELWFKPDGLSYEFDTLVTDIDQ